MLDPGYAIRVAIGHGQRDGSLTIAAVTQLPVPRQPSEPAWWNGRHETPGPALGHGGGRHGGEDGKLRDPGRHRAASTHLERVIEIANALAGVIDHLVHRQRAENPFDLVVNRCEQRHVHI